jgi:hypothetical protein
LKETVLVEKFFVRERDGRRRIDFLRSAAEAGRWMSSPQEDKCGRPDGESISSSLLGITSGDGDGSVI